MTTAHEAKARARIRGILAEAGCDGWYHARLIGGNGQSIGDPDQPLVAAASMYKVPLLIAACRAIDSSELDPLERMVIACRGPPASAFSTIPFQRPRGTCSGR